jgi:pimeloyl-ACP methyl ester carboxylesterase
MSKCANRRLFLQVGAASPLILATRPAGAQPTSASAGGGKTYVLVHGSWCGGWFFGPVADRLRANGHRVFTPTQTGLGERKHLLSREITLDTFVDDLVNVVEWEELNDVILVGHSSAGGPISGVADRMPDRIRHVIYLDSFILRNGQSFFSASSPEVAEARRKSAHEVGGVSVVPPPLGGLSGLGLSDGPVTDWFRRRVTPQPISTYETPLKLGNPVIGNGKPCTYVAFTAPAFPGPEPSRRWAKSQTGWTWVELAAGHAAPVIVPDKVADLLAGIG